MPDTAAAGRPKSYLVQASKPCCSRSLGTKTEETYPMLQIEIYDAVSKVRILLG